MRIIGVLAYNDLVLADVGELEQTLFRLGYPVRVEEMRFHVDAAQVRDYYYEDHSLVLWICRCFNDPRRCQEAIELFLHDPEVILVAISPPAYELAVQQTAGTSVPVVFTHLDEPLPNLPPNVTGVVSRWPEALAERLEILSQVVPVPQVVHTFFNPVSALSAQEAAYFERCAQDLHFQAIAHPARTDQELRAVLNALHAKSDHAILRLSDTAFAGMAGLMGATAYENYIPYIGLRPEELERCKALYCYDYQGAGEQAAIILDEILNGRSPAEVSVRSPERKTLGVNRQAAQDLGLILSPASLNRADITLPARGKRTLNAILVSLLMLGIAVLSAMMVIAARMEPVPSIALVLASIVVMMLVFWLVLNRLIVQPLKRLTTAAVKIGAGDLQAYIGDVAVEDEIGTLARALRRMRSNLTMYYEATQSTTHELEKSMDELYQAYRSLQKTQHDLEIANRRLIEADDQARFAMTTYIHDEILGTLHKFTAAAEKNCDPQVNLLAAELEKRLRHLRFGLSVPILRNMGLELRRLLQETLPQMYPHAAPLRLSMDLATVDQCGDLEPALAFLIYRFVNGAASNVYRHACASLLSVRAAREGGSLSICIQDNGAGFEEERIEQFIEQGHYFFHDIRTRCRQYKGEFRVSSHPGQGTTLTIVLPIRAWQKSRPREAMRPKVSRSPR